MGQLEYLSCAYWRPSVGYGCPLEPFFYISIVGS
jgi:hypothetical protein